MRIASLLLVAGVLSLVFGLGFLLIPAAAWLGMLALQALTAAVAFRMDRESLRPLWTSAGLHPSFRFVPYLFS